MADIVSLPASARERSGKGAARATRRAGHIPAVVYGNKESPTLISVEPKLLKQQLSRSGFFTRLVDIDVAGKKERVLPRDVQYHPVTDQPIHVDFMRVAANATVTVAVPVQFINETQSPGLKKGGVLNIVRHEVDLICPVAAIPQHITVDLAGRDIGDSVHISMVELPEGVRPVIADRDFTIATVAAPTVQTEEETRPAAAAEAAPAERKPVPAAPGGAAAPKAAAPAKAPAKK